MSTQNEQPTHDESADEELSESLAGHADLPEGDEANATESLEEIDDSPVRTKNS